MESKEPWFNTYAGLAGGGHADGPAVASAPSAGASALARADSVSSGTAASGAAPTSERRLREQLDATYCLVDQLREELQQRSAVVTQLRSELDEQRARAVRLEKESCQVRTHTIVRRNRAIPTDGSPAAGGPQLVGSMTSMEDDKLRTTSEMARLEAELEGMRHMTRALQNDIHRKSTALRKLEKELKERVLKVNQLEEEVETQRTTVASLRGQLQQSRQDAVTAIEKRGGSPTSRTAADSLNISATATNQKADAATSPMASDAGQEFVALQEELDYVAGQLKRANQGLDSRTCLLHTLEQQLRLEMESTCHLESELHDKTATISEMSADLTGKLATIGNLQQMLGSMTITLSNLEKELADKSSTSDVLSAQLAAKTQAVEGLEGCLRKMQEELRSKGMAMLTLQNEVQAKTVQVTRLEQELQAKGSAICEHEEEATRLRTALATLQQRLAQSEADLQRKDAKCATLQRHIDGLTSRLAELEAGATRHGDASPQSMSYFRSQIEALQAALTSANHEAKRKAGLLDKVYTSNQTRVVQLEEELLYTRRELAYLRHKLAVRKAKRAADAAASAGIGIGTTLGGSGAASSADGGDSPCSMGASSGGGTPNSLSNGGTCKRAYSISPLSSPKHSAGYNSVFGGGSGAADRVMGAEDGAGRAAPVPFACAPASAPSLLGGRGGRGPLPASLRQSFSFSTHAGSPRAKAAMRQAALLRGAAAALGAWDSATAAASASAGGELRHRKSPSTLGGGGMQLGSKLQQQQVKHTPPLSPSCLRASAAGVAPLVSPAGSGSGRSTRCEGTGYDGDSSGDSTPCASPGLGRSGRCSSARSSCSPPVFDNIELVKACAPIDACSPTSSAKSPAIARSCTSRGSGGGTPNGSSTSTKSSTCMPTHELLQGPMFISPAASPRSSCLSSSCTLRGLSGVMMSSPKGSPLAHTTKVLSPLSGSPRQWTDIGVVKRQLMAKLLASSDVSRPGLDLTCPPSFRKTHSYGSSNSIRLQREASVSNSVGRCPDAR